MNSSELNKKYPSLSVRDNKKRTFHTLVMEMITFYKDQNPDDLEDYELDKIGVSYVLKKCIKSHHKNLFKNG